MRYHRVTGKVYIAGWLPPAVVREATSELGWAKDWIGKANREDQTLPVLPEPN